MSAGLQLLHSVITNGARDIFRSLRDTYFTEDEQPAWRFVTGFFDTYGALPSPDTCAQNGFYFPMAEGPVAYFRDQLRNRVIYSVYVREQQGLMGLLNEGRMPEFVQFLEAMVSEMRGVETTRDTFTLREAMDLVLADFAEAQATIGMRGVPYGFPTLDEATGGARRGDLVSIVARPGIGKSFTIAYSACAAWSAGNSVAMVSNEMHALEFARRILGMGSGVNADFIQRGHVSEWGEEMIRSAVARIDDMPPFHILVGDLTKSIRDVDAIIQEHDPDAVYVDAGYLMKPTKVAPGSKKFELASETMRELKGLALSRNKPIIQTVQFNRQQKADEEQSLDNIGQTDEVGQLSSVVIGAKKGPSPHESTQRVYRVIKNRHGRDNFNFTTRFEHSPFNMDEIEEQPSGTDANGDWDGTQGPAPARDEWTAV